jgi:hypothetical protein
MLPKTNHTSQHKKIRLPKMPCAMSGPEPVARPVSSISAARAAVREFLSTELGAREIRITKIIPLDDGTHGWEADAEILVPNLEVKMLNLPLTQEVFELEQYVVELESDLSVRSYRPLGAAED